MFLIASSAEGALMDAEPLNTLLTAIEQVQIPVWILVVSAAANVVLAVVAVRALYLAIHRTDAASEQAQAAIKANEDRARRARAATIFDFDRLWESLEFSDSRTAFHKLRREVVSFVNNNDKYKHLDESGKIDALREECSRRLYEMRDADEARYLKIMKLPGFFETLGFLVERDSMQLDDILDLYGGALIQLHDVVGIHISSRSKEDIGMPSGYFKYFQSLAKKAQEQSDQRQR